MIQESQREIANKIIDDLAELAGERGNSVSQQLGDGSAARHLSCSDVFTPEGQPADGVGLPTPELHGVEEQDMTTTATLRNGAQVPQELVQTTMATNKSARRVQGGPESGPEGQ